jgi:leucyl-tRNA synthetase
VPDGSGNPLNKTSASSTCECPKCGKAARRETDTMDTFVDSSWYYMRYCSPDATTHGRRAQRLLDADGPVHRRHRARVLHLLYARFWTKVMRDLGLVKFDEPFTRLFTQGMLLAECFYREDPATGRPRWYYPAEDRREARRERVASTGAVALKGRPARRRSAASRRCRRARTTSSSRATSSSGSVRDTARGM